MWRTNRASYAGTLCTCHAIYPKSKFALRGYNITTLFHSDEIYFQPQDFTLNINEDGSNFDEKIEIDEELEEQTILFRIPPHNNIEDTTFLNDFKLVSFTQIFYFEIIDRHRNIQNSVIHVAYNEIIFVLTCRRFKKCMWNKCWVIY